ncbi:MAG: carboxypeptidase-like regulatory domain-containing protein [Candidatus Tumulicola sp.]
MIAAAVLGVVTLFVGLTQTGSGDSTRVIGTVTGGPACRPVPHARVVASSPSEVAETKADGRGRYAFLTLLPGVYDLTATPDWAASYDAKPSPARATQPSRSRCSNDEPALVELSAGVEYLINLGF